LKEVAKMAIKRITVNNFTVLEKFDAEFCDGVNVFIGENGTGKTHLLKIMYAFCQAFGLNNDPLSMITSVQSNLIQLFPTLEADKLLNEARSASLIITIDDLDYPFYPDDFREHPHYPHIGEKEMNASIFIPTAEMLSHSKGFLNLYKKFNLPFDKSQVDIIVNAGLPDAKNLSLNSQKMMYKIAEIIGGNVVYEDDIYYIAKNNGDKISFQLEAEGIKKFALLWQLLKNGSIEKDTILFWDEPEANINPKLIPTLVDILLELARNGVQIFVATHDYVFAKYFEVKMSESDSVKFHALYKTDDGVKCETQDKFIALENNSIMQESIRLYKEEVKKVMG